MLLAEELFNQAKKLLKAVHVNKVEAQKVLAAAATLGHKEARSMLAWAQLLGNHVGSSSSRQDINAALITFKELVETGLPSAHTVNYILMILYLNLKLNFHKEFCILGNGLFICHWSWRSQCFTT